MQTTQRTKDNKGADNVNNALSCIRKIISNFCTFGTLQPEIACSSLPKSFDRALFQHFREHTEIYNTDAEQVMLLAGEALRTMRDGEEPFFPNLKLVVKDPTHAARRWGNSKTVTGTARPSSNSNRQLKTYTFMCQ